MTQLILKDDNFLCMSKINQHKFTTDQLAVLNSLSLDSGVVVCKRISEPTHEQVKFSIAQAIQMAKDNNLNKYLIDARGTLPPTAELRQVLRQFLNHFIGHFDAMVIVIDENPTLKVSTQFIFHNHDIPDNMKFEVCTSVEDGMGFLEQCDV